jgi:hypothetical protein
MPARTRSEGACLLFIPSQKLITEYPTHMSLPATWWLLSTVRASGRLSVSRSKAVCSRLLLERQSGCFMSHDVLHQTYSSGADSVSMPHRILHGSRLTQAMGVYVVDATKIEPTVQDADPNNKNNKNNYTFPVQRLGVYPTTSRINQSTMLQGPP